MKWQQVEHALQFLEKETDGIVIQVPYTLDITKVQDYIIDRHSHDLGILYVQNCRLVTKVGIIRIEFVNSPSCGIGHEFPCFLVERANGDNGLGAVDLDSFEDEEKESPYEKSQEEGRDNCTELS